MTDEELMLAVRSGDESAFELLVSRYRDWAITLSYRFTGDRWLAEEIAQDAFTRLYFAKANYQPRAKFRTYFYALVRHAITDAWRKRKCVTVMPLEDFAALAATSEQQPDVKVLRDERERIVGKAILGLCDDQRMALVLREFGGLCYEEISQAMGLKVSNVKVLIHRARKGLAAILVEKGEGRDEFLM